MHARKMGASIAPSFPPPALATPPPLPKLPGTMLLRLLLLLLRPHILVLVVVATPTAAGQAQSGLICPKFSPAAQNGSDSQRQARSYSWWIAVGPGSVRHTPAPEERNNLLPSDLRLYIKFIIIFSEQFRTSPPSMASYLGFGTLQSSGSLRVNDALYPSKSGLINKHTVDASVGVPCARLSPD